VTRALAAVIVHWQDPAETLGCAMVNALRQILGLA